CEIAHRRADLRDRFSRQRRRDVRERLFRRDPPVVRVALQRNHLRAPGRAVAYAATYLARGGVEPRRKRKPPRRQDAKATKRIQQARRARNLSRAYGAQFTLLGAPRAFVMISNSLGALASLRFFFLFSAPPRLRVNLFARKVGSAFFAEGGDAFAVVVRI